MAKYLTIKNDNKNVIVDDSYNVPMLIAKAVVTTYSELTTSFKQPNGTVVKQYLYYAQGKYSGGVVVATWDTEDDLPVILDPFPEGITANASRFTQFNRGLIVAARSLSGDTMVDAEATLLYDPNIGQYSLRLNAQSDIKDGQIEVCVYATTKLKPKKLTMAIYNKQKELLYDVMRPAMHFLGSLYGGVNVWQSVARTFDFNLPAGVKPEDCYITSRGGAPYYSAYKISSSGVSWADTTFKTVVTSPTPQTLRVQVVRARSVSGSNSAYGYGGFFENLLYCPYPLGVYI